MAIGRVIALTGGLAAAGFAGHFALDAFADQKATEAVERIRQKLPDGTELSYAAIDGDPYSVGAVIEGLTVSHPAYGQSDVARLTISGTKLDDKGGVAAIGTLELESVTLATPEPLAIAITRLRVTDLSGSGLRTLASQPYSPTALATVEFDDIAGEGLTVQIEGTELAVSNFEVIRENRKAGTIEIAETTLRSPQAGLGFARLTTAIAQAEDGTASADYAIDDLRLIVERLPDQTSSTLNLEGQTSYEPEGRITAGRLSLAGRNLAETDVQFRLRAIEFLPGLLNGNPIPAKPDQAPALLSLTVDYRDQGAAENALSAYLGNDPEVRSQALMQVRQLAKTFTGGKMPANFKPLIAELDKFVRQPARLQLELAPPRPVDPANLMVAAMLNPGGIVDMLGLSIVAE